MNFAQFAISIARLNSSSVAFSLPYLTLFSIVSSNNTASCNTMAILSRKSFFDILEISMPSIEILPESIS